MAGWKTVLIQEHILPDMDREALFEVSDALAAGRNVVISDLTGGQIVVGPRPWGPSAWQRKEWSPPRRIPREAGLTAVGVKLWPENLGASMRSIVGGEWTTQDVLDLEPPFTMDHGEGLPPREAVGVEYMVRWPLRPSPEEIEELAERLWNIVERTDDREWTRIIERAEETRR